MSSAVLYSQQPPPPSNMQMPQQHPYQYPSSYAPPPAPKRSNTLRTLILFVLVAAVGGVAALVLVGGYNLDDLELRLRGKTYKAASFDVRYPQDWSPVEVGLSDTAMFATTDSLSQQIERGEPVESLSSGEAVVSFTVGEDNVETVSQAASPTSQFGAAAQVQVASVEKKDIGPHTATETKFSVTQQRGAVMDGIVIVVIVNDTPFVVEGLAAPGEITDFQSMIEAMIRSLQVDDGGSSGASANVSASAGSSGGSGSSGSGTVPDDNTLCSPAYGWINAVNTRNTESAMQVIHPDARWLNPREYTEELYPYEININPLEITVQEKSAQEAVVVVRAERRGVNRARELIYPDHIMSYTFYLKPDGAAWKIDFIGEDVNNFHEVLLDDVECAPNCQPW